MDKTYIIDFIGVGGSGKTYISRRLAKKIGNKAAISSDFKLNIRICLKFFFKKSLTVLRVINFLQYTKQKSWNDFRKSFFAVLNYLIKKEYLTNNKDIQYVIFDEGLLHKLRQIRRRSKKSDLTLKNIPEQFKKLLFGFPDVIVFVNTDMDTLIQRNVKKNMSFNIEHTKTLDGDISESIQLTKEDLLSFQEDFNGKVFEMDNANKESTEYKLNKVKEYLTLNEQ